MAEAKTKTKVVRNLLIEEMKKRKMSIKDLAAAIGITRFGLYNIINCYRSGDLEVWKKIQEVLSIKDSQMWSIITTTKRIYR